MLVYLLLFSEQMASSWCDILFAEVTEDSKSKKHMEGIVNDLPKENGNYVIYRFVGLINFMNIDRHYDNISFLLNKHQDKILVISFMYVHFVDYEAIHCISELINELKNTDFKENFALIEKRLKISITESKYKIINDNHFLKMIKDLNIVHIKELTQEIEENRHVEGPRIEVKEKAGAKH
jgi:MFS superfamily sulfate permease-like transporter